ncbi:M48 family metalloprotease [Variovorax terrae]|uniref:M48 family metallopeptidase n=1 Tax=Variovorax terrae TaxID=2923278 RepID=A0A9X1VVJ8_9BURK|nr:M48 family metalloprotease [Variovorax terrae]MCJ0764561.1 M48 family metallopeptidase [Variovorax terrae]
MSPERLNQLKLPDETKLGLGLVIVYLLFDVTQSLTFGGWQMAEMLGLEPNARTAGVLQLILLAVISVGLVVWRRRSILRSLGAQRLEEADPALAEDAAYLARHIARGRGSFLVTSNFSDMNAFCFAGGRTSWVVLGAGLRVLFRKQRERARAVLAHECAHLDSGDVGYVVIAWYLLCAYALLAVVNLVVSQGYFWLRVPSVLPAYDQAGGLVGLLEVNARYIFSAGFSGLIAVLGVWLLQRYFFQLREFRADERAAQAGFRGALVEMFSNPSAIRSLSPWRALLTMHPASVRRIDRLSSEQAWGRLDVYFLAGMGFIVARLGSEIPSGNSGDLPSAALTLSELLSRLGDLLQAGGWPLAASISFEVVMAFIVALHTLRMAATQARLGAGLLYRLSFLFSATLVVFIGAFLGEISAWGELARLANVSQPWTMSNALDTSFLTGLLLAGMYCFFATAIVMVAPRALRHAPRSTARQLVSLLLCALGLASLLQAGANLIGIAVGAVFGGLPPWDVPWMPASSVQPVEGVPSAMQAFTILLILTAILSFPRWLGAWQPKAVVAVNEGWLV